MGTFPDPEKSKASFNLLRLMLVHVSSWETFREDSKIEATALLSLGKGYL